MAEEQTKPNESQVETPETEAQEQAAQADAGDATAEYSEADVAQLQQALAAAQEEAASAKDQALRAVADAQNARRRAEQDVEKAHKFGSEKLINEMLPIIDSLERALEACQSDDDGVKVLREGVEMTYNMFVQGLAKFNVDQVNPKGEAFNPELHQAMTMVPSPDQAPNTVLDVMQKGYTLHGRLIRPAMVVVVQG
jgi:molecular chaperone GrpE